jgi:hypothetical protein
MKSILKLVILNPFSFDILTIYGLNDFKHFKIKGYNVITYVCNKSTWKYEKPFFSALNLSF